jgi:hypothetical protein
VLTKTSRAEVKKICADPIEENLIYGGLDNGRICIWDLREDKGRASVVS